MSEPIEELGPLLRIPANLVSGGEVLDELEHSGAQLVGEMRSRGADDRVHAVAGRLGHGGKANG